MPDGLGAERILVERVVAVEELTTPRASRIAFFRQVEAPSDGVMVKMTSSLTILASPTSSERSLTSTSRGRTPPYPLARSMSRVRRWGPPSGRSGGGVLPDLRNVVDEVPEQEREQDAVGEDVGAAQERGGVESEGVEEIPHCREPRSNVATSFAVDLNRVVRWSWMSASPWTATEGSLFIWRL